MSVYLDNARNSFKGMLMCHMVADTEEELHTMAEKIGLKREWFQPKSIPHYDLSLAKKQLALKEGAILDSSKFLDFLRRHFRAL